MGAGLSNLADMANEIGTDLLGENAHPIKQVFKGQGVTAIQTNCLNDEYFFMLVSSEEGNWNALSFKQVKTQVVKVKA